MRIRPFLFAFACAASAAGRLDAAVLQTASTPVNIGETLRVADSLRGAGDLPAARRLTESLEDRYPQDARVLMLLGRIHLAWPRIGRYTAESLLARAARIDSTNPEPCYYIADVGVALGQHDGEEMQHAGLLCVLGRNPDYRDAWDRWKLIYRNADRRREMIDALARHPRSLLGSYRRAQLLVEMDHGAEAADLLEHVAERMPTDAGVLAWLARALFLASRDDSATAVYGRAMDHADADTGEVLWKQIRGITSPDERRRYEQTPAYLRPTFFRLFWAKRNGDLSSSANGRISEHFQRLSYAIRLFSLRNPGSRYFRSALYRALAGDVGGVPDMFGEAGPAYAFAAENRCGEIRPGSRLTQSPQLGAMPRIDTTNGDPLNRDHDLDDRGMIWLRHGAPTTRLIGPQGVSESWCYASHGREVLRVSFMKRTGAQVGGGDFVVTAMVGGEVEATRALLTTDSPSQPADMTFAFWLATFRGAQPGTTDLVVFSDTMSAQAALLDSTGVETVRGAGTDGSLLMAAPPGPYFLMLDGSRDGHSNRFRGPATLPAYGGRLATSSLLVANAASRPERAAMIAAAARRLDLSNAEPVRVYAEIYGLGEAQQRSRFAVSYIFERLDGRGRVEPGREVALRFDREEAAGPRTIESLVIDPGRLEAGRYRLRLEVHDLVRDVVSTSSNLEFRLR